MSDEKPVPETIESIAAGIRELRQSMESRFDQVAMRSEVNSRFDDVKTQLRTEIGELRTQLRSELADVRTQLRADIEAVRDDVRLVAEAFGSQATVNERNDSAHTNFTKHLDDHDTRIVALERSPGQTSS